MNKEYKDLKFTDDFMFCKILSTNLDLTRELLELILGVKIRKVKLTEPQKEIEILAQGRGIRLDVYVEDDKNTIYDIEMQTTKQKDLPKRSRYYQGMIDMNIIERGDRFEALKKTFIIFICLSDPFDKGRHIYTFETRCKEDLSLSLGDEITKVFLNPNGVLDDVSPEMDAFLKYLKSGIAESDFTRKLEVQVQDAVNHKEWRTEYMTLYMRDLEKKDEGRNETLYSLVQKGAISVETAAVEANISVEEFEKQMLEAGYKIPALN